MHFLLILHKILERENGERIQKGIKSSALVSFGFCLFISFVVCVFAKPLMEIFVDPSHIDIVGVGVRYLRIEGAFYFGIGFLFLLYGFYRAVNRPGMSVVLTVISLGTAGFSSLYLGADSIYRSDGNLGNRLRIGWILADLTGVIYYRKKKNQILTVRKEFL